jgi:hypothetical protein
MNKAFALQTLLFSIGIITMTAPASLSENIRVVITRKIQPGQYNLQGTCFTTIDRVEGESALHGAYAVDIKGLMNVNEPKGGSEYGSIKVGTLTFTRPGSKKPVIAPGSVILIHKKSSEELDFLYKGRSLDQELIDSLSAILPEDQSPLAPDSSQMIFVGSSDRHKPGDSWAVNAKNLAVSLGRDNVLDLKSVSGQVKLNKIKSEGLHPCAEVGCTLSYDSTLDGCKQHTKQIYCWEAPLDLTLPVVSFSGSTYIKAKVGSAMCSTTRAASTEFVPQLSK